MDGRRKLVAILCAFGLGFISSACAPTGEEESALVDALFAEFDSGSPGAAVVVVKDGETVHAAGYGKANLEWGIYNSPTSVFRTASVSKQFTAACVALLVLDGELGLDDPIVLHFPELPADVYGAATVGHLVHHTSGVRDYLTLGGLANVDVDGLSAQDILLMLSRQRAVNFEPGSEHLYSNSGYFLLAQLVERVSGLTIRQFAAERLFGPLQMENTQFYDDTTRIVPRRSAGYSPDEKGGYVINMTRLNVVGDGGILTTAQDMAKWLNALIYRQGLEPEFFDLIFSTEPLEGGSEYNYAFGLIVDERFGRRNIGHGGAYVGFRTAVSFYPDDRLGIAVLANRSDINPDNYCDDIAQIYLGITEETDEATEEPQDSAEPKVIELTEEQLQRYTGMYIRPESQNIWELSVEEGGLRVEAAGWYSAKFMATDPLHFVSVDGPLDVELRFEEPPAGQRPTFVYSIRSAPRGTLEPIEPPSYTAEQLAQFAGSYYSDELDVTYTLAYQDGQLCLVGFPAEGTEPLKPYLSDKFTAGPFNIEFERNPSGAVQAFAVDAGRVRGLRFVKQ